MLSVIGVDVLDQLIDETVPPRSGSTTSSTCPGPRTETDVLAELRAIAEQNTVAPV